MNPTYLRAAVKDMRNLAYRMRTTANRLDYHIPDMPKDALTVMRDAALQIDHAANDMLNEFGEPLPDGVL